MRLRQLLANYPIQQEAEQLIHNLKYGHELHYTGPSVTRWCTNLKSVTENPQLAREKIMKEVELGRIAGPFNTIEESGLESVIVSPIGLVPKSTGGFRVIHHLSYPRGEGINAFISDEFSRVSYARFDDALRILASYGPHSKMAKVDVKSAYRLLPMRTEDFKYLGFHIEGKLFIEKMAPMGARGSARQWEAFGHIWEWLIKQQKHFKGATIRYLDDLMVITPPEDNNSHRALEIVENLCEDIGLPLATEKTVPPTTQITFLGITIDSSSQTISVPEGKVADIKTELTKLQQKRNVKVRKILSLAGSLSFMTRAIPAGRPFLRRMFDGVKGKEKHRWTLVTEGIKLDIQTWLDFLDGYNGSTKFPPLVRATPPEIDIYTDASLAGYGIVCDKQWVMETFPSFDDPQPSMTWRELYPILVAVYVFENKLKDKKVCFHTDNSGVFHILHKLSSDKTEIMDLVRPLTLQCLKLNIMICTKFVPTQYNIWADPISRISPQIFLKRAPWAEPSPLQIPEHLKLN